MYQVNTRISTLNVVACKTLTKLLVKERAINCKIYRKELTYLIVYIGVMVGKGCIKFQCNASISYYEMVSQCSCTQTLTRISK